VSGSLDGSLLTPYALCRLLKDTTPLQRGIIRHVILLLDLSQSMMEKDLRPTRYLLTLRYAQEFIREFFEQNPISQIGVLGLRDGLAVRISDMSGNPTEHITAIQDLRSQDPKGLPSLQNGLEMARGALLYV
jgi:transcription initiation factor TFIIH subunit 2